MKALLMVGMPSDLGWDNPKRYHQWEGETRKKCRDCGNHSYTGFCNHAADVFRCRACYIIHMDEYAIKYPEEFSGYTIG